MPALLGFPRSEPFGKHLPSSLLRRATALLASRQDRDDDESYTVIPAQYGALHSSPSPGVVAGIVLGSVAGFLLILAAIYTCLNGFPMAVTSDGVSTYVSRADDRSRRRASRRRRSTSRHSAAMYEVRTRTTTTTRERVVPDIVDTPTASAFEPSRRAPSAHRAPPPPRVVPRDDDSSGSEDEVVVIEEHSPPRRKGRRPSPSYFSDDRSRQESSYRDAESDLYSHSRR